MKGKRYDIPLLAAVVLIGAGIGYLLGDDSSELKRLREGLNAAKSKSNQPIARPQTFVNSFLGARETGSENLTLHQATDQLWTTNALLLKAVVTPDDMELTEALQKRRDAGEFILKNERPLFKKLQELDFKTIAGRNATKRSEAYSRLFSDLGMPLETSEQLQKHLQKINEAALDAESAISQVADARRKYDQRLRSLLSEEGHSRYEQYELSKPAQYEWENIQKFAAKQNAAIDSRYGEEIVRLLLDANAVYGGLSHGPYGSLPQLPVNPQQAVAQVQQELQHLLDSTPEMNRRMANSTLSDAERKVVSDYLAQKIERKQARILSLQNPAPAGAFQNATIRWQ